MLREIKVENYKSILDDTIELGRLNVFIGANGSGKTNILEALAMVAASKDNDLNVEGLYNRGVRVTKPSLTFSSFIGNKSRRLIKVQLKLAFPKYSWKHEVEDQEGGLRVNVPVDVKEDESFIIIDVPASFYTEADDIYAPWKEETADNTYKKDINDFVHSFMNEEKFKELAQNYVQKGKYLEKDVEWIVNTPAFVGYVKDFVNKRIEELAFAKFKEKFKFDFLSDFLIYTLNTQALRGIVSESKKQPLGINGEGLDVLLANLGEAESEKIQQYHYLISWLDELVLDEKDVLKYKGHKLGRSTSILYFKDKFMRKNNNVFSAENANEGALHILFYLALFISKKTPQLFAIDNIETALNPRVCRTLVKELAQLAKENNKQALITTHNPAILDGLNLNDDEQRLFVVYRTDEGHTKTKRIKLKPETKEGNLKLSELWMRGHLGGIPNDF